MSFDNSNETNIKEEVTSENNMTENSVSSDNAATTVKMTEKASNSDKTDASASVTTEKKDAKKKPELKKLSGKKKKKLIKRILIIFAAVICLFIILINSGIMASFVNSIPPLKALVEKVNFTIPVFNINVNLSEWFRLNADEAENSVTTYTVGTRSITQILTSTGTIEPNEQYSVSALVSGEILGDYFEEGDTVIEDQLLYTVDSDKLDSGVTKAENALKSANRALDDALENLEKLNIESDYNGIIKKLYIEEGDEITAGALIADVVDDYTMCIDIPFLDVDCQQIHIGDTAVITFSGTSENLFGRVTEISSVANINSIGASVREVTISVTNTGSITNSTRAFASIGELFCTSDAVFYYNDEGKIYSEASGTVDAIYLDEGDRISEHQFIARLSSEDLEKQIDKLRDTVEEAENALRDAKDAFDDYNITAPITGKVISKEYKTGDTLSSGSQGAANVLAVIYDMSALKFTMSIDELDIDKIDEGQDVIITCDSREGKEYHGVISNISIQGTTTNGTTIYPVEVIIRNVEDDSQRTVDEDGTINKVFMTGMTSTEKTYNVITSEQSGNITILSYDDNIVITRVQNEDGTFILYDGEEQLKEYLDGTYTEGSKFYKFSADYSELTLEIQNDKQMLRPGMNIDAEIIVERRENVIAVPLSAVSRGNIVKVLKNKQASKQADNTKPTDNNQPVGLPNEDTDNKGQRSGYGTASKDDKYDEIRVTVGISDDDYVEITSGLNIGDIIIIEEQTQAPDQGMMAYGMMGGNGMPAGGGMHGGNMPSGGNMGGGMYGGMGR